MRDRFGPGECVVGLDVGGTGMKGALLDRDLRPLFVARRPTPRGDGPDVVVSEIAAALTSLAKEAADQDLTVRGAGVVVPGIVDEDTARAVWSGNIGWRDLPLAELLESDTGLAVTLGHDVRAGGCAESELGAARGAKDVLFVAIGTGVSAAVICDGRPVVAGGFAGELGHLVVEPGGSLCVCGVQGCLETVATASAIASSYTARTGRTVKGASDVTTLLGEGDAEAQRIWDRATDALATSLVMATTLLGPELIVLGGGLAEAGDLLLEPVRTRLEERFTFQRRPGVVRAALGDAAGCLGAGLYAWRAVYDAPGTQPAESVEATVCPL
ncbi:ROK family protein [Streptomyces sp. NPDC102264]|uniref:ROK family protein n=1 Tax=Streptomyces sp. NPDC102264 TaxID=3366149 RepID=UPI003829D3F2